MPGVKVTISFNGIVSACRPSCPETNAAVWAEINAGTNASKISSPAIRTSMAKQTAAIGVRNSPPKPPAMPAMINVLEITGFLKGLES